MQELSGMTLAKGIKQLVIQKALLTILRGLPYFSWFTPIINMEASAGGAEMMTHLAPSFKWAPASSTVAKTPVDSMTYSASASPHLMVAGYHSWKMEMGFLLEKKQISCSQPWLCPWICYEWNHPGTYRPCSWGQWGVIDGDSIRFARVKSPGDQMPKIAKSIYSKLHHCVLGTRLALHQKMWLCVKWGGVESQYLIY